MHNLDEYGLVKTTFAGKTFSDIEPVGEEFLGVKYYRADDVDFAMSRDHDVKARLNRDVDRLAKDMDSDKEFYSDQLAKRQETVEELFSLVDYWKKQYITLRDAS